MSDTSNSTRLCTECKFLVLTDEGYSNWTVENTTAICLHNANPKFPCDSYYGRAPEHKFAAQCEHYAFGTPVHFDVDRDDGAVENYASDAIVKAMLLLEKT
jgi:hypothetical protein